MKKFIKWFNGKKRSIGVIGLSILQLAVVKNHLTPDVFEILQWLFITVGGVGIAHGDIKSEKSLTKKVGNNIKTVVNNIKKIKK